MPTMQTRLSVIFSTSEAFSTFSSANTSELPIWTAPWTICVMPVPEPPPWTVTWTPGFSSMNSSAAASHSGWSAVEPTAVMEPDSSAEAELEALEELEAEPSDELLPPQPTRPMPATAAVMTPAAPRNVRRETFFSCIG